MQRIFVTLSALLMMLGCATGSPTAMSQDSLAVHIEEIAGHVETSPNVVEFRYENVMIACVSDANHDRMRLIAPVAELDPTVATGLEILLIANFHTTLDARYAISDGVIYAAFLHPLSTLTRSQLESAIRQVAALSLNFGTSYSSDELIYGVRSGREI